VESIERFEKALLKMLNILTLNNSKVVVLGDINLDLKQIRTNNHIKRYLLSCTFKCAIDIPTRISPQSQTLIGHIYTNITREMVDCAGVAISNISHHYGIFVNINCKTNLHKQKASIQIRDI